MIRTAVLICVLYFLICGCAQSRETDVHCTMAYIDGWQVPVPPEAISPFEPKDVTYVSEPLLELDSDWNMDVKLFSKYRYTDEFVENWRAKQRYTPTLPVMTHEGFFKAVDLNHPGLEKVRAAVSRSDFTRAIEEYLSYQAQRPRSSHLKPRRVSTEAGQVAVKEADAIMADPVFPACIPGMKFSLWGLMGCLERAYLHTEDIKYAEAWLEMFNHWYMTYRPPAQRPRSYISFIWMPYWRTLGAAGSARGLCESERWLVRAAEHGLDTDNVFNVYKSILEHGRFLHLCNDVFMPSNWQTAQCEGLIKIGTYFPAYKMGREWREHAWQLDQEHIVRETYNDGTHCENSVGYAVGVIGQYRSAARLVRKTEMRISEEYLRRWKSMYLWAVKILPPTGNYPPCGDNGIGVDGSLIKKAIIDGALEFADPTMKYFAQRYPNDVLRTAEEEFENTAEVLDAYNRVTAEKPSFTSILLPDTGWAVMRQSWDVNSLYMFFDYGWDEAWHSHPDFGSFNIWAYGRPIVTECGRSGSYEADISKRWYKQTIGHNTVMVDSRSMRKCVNNRLNQWWTGERYDFADATSDGYRWIGVLHNRRVIFVKPDYWIITDFLPGPSYYGTSFQTSGYHEFDWLAHFQPTKLKIDRKKKRIDTSNEDANAALVPLNADQVELRVRSGPMSTPIGVADSPYVSLHQEGMAFVQYQVLLVPYQGNEPPEIGITHLAVTEVDRVHRRNVGYEIAIFGRRDILLETGNQDEPVSFGEYRFHGAVAHIYDASNPAAAYLLIDAKSLTYDGRLLFSAPGRIKAIEFAVVARLGHARVLEIMTHCEVSGMKVLAPGVSEVRINGDQHEFSREGEYVVIR
ncbi:MAG: alginate lyase family protein [Phycisphaerales bacterium]|nr:alginate lyase family protein [Phycisphaerales bacterium]